MIRRVGRTGVLVAALLATAGVGAGSAAGGAATPYPAPVSVSVLETTGNLAQHLTPQPTIAFTSAAPAAGTPVISVNDTQVLQKIRGFGASMTDSSAWLIEKQLAPAARTRLMNVLFGSGGIDLDFVRVPIAASDFTVGAPYSYDDLPAGETDPSLRRFSVAHDRAYILPALQQVKAVDPSTTFLASPWTPPAWMKWNESLGNLHNNGTLRAFAYGPWASYIVKFLQAYGRAGIPISMVTPQNEPGNATAYPGLNMTSASLAIWIDQDLAPAIRKARLKTGIYAQDIGWGSPALAQAAVAGRAAHDLAGIAWHCYYGSPDVMGSLHASKPAIDQIVDECSPGISAIPTAEVVISSLRDWASTVALWNLALDPKGGPVQQPNTGCPGCYGLATITEGTGALRLTGAFFQLGQASEWISPGAVRVASNNFVTYTYDKPGHNFISPGLDDVAAVNPDHSRVVMAYNNETTPATFAVAWHGMSFKYTVPAGATVTFKWAPPGT